MPQVGNKHFPYTPAGKAKAKAEAAKTGKPVKHMKKGKRPAKRYNPATLAFVAAVLVSVAAVIAAKRYNPATPAFEAK